MALSPNDLKEHLAEFMAGGAYMAFWRPVMDATEVVDSDPLWSDADRAWYCELYDLVYMGGEDPVTAGERRDGITGASDLRKLIHELGLDNSAARPA